MGHMGGLINPRPGRGQYRASFSNTGGSPKPRKRAPCQKKIIQVHVQKFKVDRAQRGQVIRRIKEKDALTTTNYQTKLSHIQKDHKGNKKRKLSGKHFHPSQFQWLIK